MLSLRLLLVFLATLIIGCGAGTGPGSTADAVKFANKRLTLIKQRTTEQNENGKWFCEAMELRNATHGFYQSFKFGMSSVEATVEYEYRILSSGPHETKVEAEASKLEPGNPDWEKKMEVYIYKDGKWTSEEAGT